MQEEILGFVVSFGEGHSVRFPTRPEADALARFLARRKMEATIHAHLLRPADGKTMMRRVADLAVPA